jgi:hypothetical protein
LFCFICYASQDVYQYRFVERHNYSLSSLRRAAAAVGSS